MLEVEKFFLLFVCLSFLMIKLEQLNHIKSLHASVICTQK